MECCRFLIKRLHILGAYDSIKNFMQVKTVKMGMMRFLKYPPKMQPAGF